MSKELFYCYSLKLAGFLILKGAYLKQVKQDGEGKFLFIFDDKSLCNTYKSEYKFLKG